MSKLISLRFATICAGCGDELAVGTPAHWFAAERHVRCDACVSAATVPEVAPPGDVAGASARREYDRRAARERARHERAAADDAERRRRTKDEHPLLGGLLNALRARPVAGAESQSTSAWRKGSDGERRVADVLAPLAGVEVLHDRLIPGSRANLDHIVVGPRGVYVVDAKHYEGRVEVRDIGGLLRVDERLFVHGRDRTSLVDGVVRQVEVVREALGPALDDVRVYGVLCFVGATWGLLPRPVHVKGVRALWPTALPELVMASGPLVPRIGDIAALLRERLRPAC